LGALGGGDLGELGEELDEILHSERRTGRGQK
jgi:hypothetical protein